MAKSNEIKLVFRSFQASREGAILLMELSTCGNAEKSIGEANSAFRQKRKEKNY
jgi:hypothetical protein